MHPDRADRAARHVATRLAPGISNHRIWVGRSADTLTQLGTLGGLTEDRQLLRFDIDRQGPIRIVRIVTNESPSPVGWREILLSTLHP